MTYRYRHGWIPIAGTPAEKSLTALNKASAKYGPDHPKTKKARAKHSLRMAEARSKYNAASAARYLKTHPNAGR